MNIFKNKHFRNSALLLLMVIIYSGIYVCIQPAKESTNNEISFVEAENEEIKYNIVTTYGAGLSDTILQKIEIYQENADTITPPISETTPVVTTTIETTTTPEVTTTPEITTTEVTTTTTTTVTTTITPKVVKENIIEPTNEGYYTTIYGKEIYVNPIYNPSWNSSSHLTKRSGVYQGPSGKETYYNLNMNGIVDRMRKMGYTEENWPYWVREDGCKMLGDYIMVAANLDIRPRGSIVSTSLGIGIVCDTGGFAKKNSYQLDIATNW